MLEKTIYLPQLFFRISVLIFPVMLVACNLGASAETPAPTPDLPRVEILTPANNSQVIEFVDLPIDIVARDETNGVAKVELYVDGEKVNEAVPENNLIEPVFRVEMNWLAQGLGFHVISVIAYRLDETRSDEFIVNMEVVERPGDAGGG